MVYSQLDKELTQDIFNEQYPKGTKKNPCIVTVRQESKKNNTLSITLTKGVIGISETKIKRGDRLIQWADPESKTIYIKKL